MQVLKTEPCRIKLLPCPQGARHLEGQGYPPCPSIEFCFVGRRFRRRRRFLKKPSPGAPRTINFESLACKTIGNSNVIQRAFRGIRYQIWEFKFSVDARTHVFLSSGRQEVPANNPLILQRRHFFITPDTGLEPDAGAGTGRRGWNRTPRLEPDAGVEPDAGLEPDVQKDRQGEPQNGRQTGNEKGKTKTRQKEHRRKDKGKHKREDKTGNAEGKTQTRQTEHRRKDKGKHKREDNTGNAKGKTQTRQREHRRKDNGKHKREDKTGTQKARH